MSSVTYNVAQFAPKSLNGRYSEHVAEQAWANGVDRLVLMCTRDSIFVLDLGTFVKQSFGILNGEYHQKLEQSLQAYEAAARQRNQKRRLVLVSQEMYASTVKGIEETAEIIIEGEEIKIDINEIRYRPAIDSGYESPMPPIAMLKLPSVAALVTPAIMGHNLNTLVNPQGEKATLAGPVGKIQSPLDSLFRIN